MTILGYPRNVWVVFTFENKLLQFITLIDYRENHIIVFIGLEKFSNSGITHD